MAYTTTILNQLQQLLPMHDFQSFVGQHEADKWCKTFTTKDQLTVLLYAQATGKSSLRDIETSLQVQQKSLYHLGVHSVTKSTLGRVNTNRPYDIYESLFYKLIGKCNNFSSGTASAFTFTNDLYAIDSTTIDLCLNLFPWAHFRRVKGAIKLHTLFNIRSQIPELIIESDGKTHDLMIAEHIQWDSMAKGSIFALDRAYVDYNLLHTIHSHKHAFVVRLKKNAHILSLESLPVNEVGIIQDQRVSFVLEKALQSYPDNLRLVTYFDQVTKKTYKFLTNNFELSAKTIADIYKQRWQIELFFKWIKQHLKIKTFLGTSKNAVMTQIWVAMIYYLLLAWIKFQTKFKGSLLELTRMIKEVILQPVALIDVLRCTSMTVRRAAARASPQQVSFL
jgi:hypothetical protein